MRVWVWPERTHEEFGAERWTAEWQEVPKNWDQLTEEQREDWDYDRFPTRYVTARGPGARAKVKRALRYAISSGKTAYGSGTLQRQVVDWYVEEDRVAEWTDVGEPEYWP